jgi:phage-related protein
MSETAVQAKAMQMGLADANGELTTGALVQARMAMIIEQSGNAMGQFARESDSLAAQQKITQAQFSNLKAELGTRLLPVMLTVMGAIQKMIDWFSNLSPGVQNTILAIGGFLIVLGPVLTVLGSVISVVGIFATTLPAAIGAVTTALVPVIVPMLAIIAVLALLKAAWDNNWGGIQEKTKAVTDWIQNTIQGFLDAIKEFWSKHGGAIMSVVTGIWEGIKKIIDIHLNFIGGIAKAFLLILQGDFRGAGEKLRETFISTWESIKSLFAGLLTGIVNAFKNIDWAQLGKDIINGIIAGLKAAANWLYNTVRSIVGNVIDFAKGLLGISSPSRIFADIGKQINQGMALGIRATVDLPTKELRIPTVGGSSTPYSQSPEDMNEYIINLLQTLPDTIAKSMRDNLAMAGYGQ